MERQRVCQREEKVVILDRGHVDRLARQLAIAGVELVEVAERDHGLTHPPRGQVHHRIAQVAYLDVHHRSEMAVLVMELAGVPHHRRLTIR